jgi:hypothetical protein
MAGGAPFEMRRCGGRQGSVRACGVSVSVGVCVGVCVGVGVGVGVGGGSSA